MRIFTLGKNGIPLFFFALFLFSGTSSYGQCPTLTDQTPDDFCYLSTISDLTERTGATVTGGEVAWFRTEDSTTPIPENELLQDGNYYAGNDSGDCTNRELVAVTVDNIGAPTTLFGVIFQPCEYSESDTSNVGDLTALIDGNEVEIFTEEFSGEPLEPNTLLVDGTSYFAGQRNPDTDCPTSRLAIRYDPILAEAPDAEPVQIFCEGATVADLEAQGTNPDTQAFRWYSTDTSNPPLDPSTPLIDGETYYASQIINRTNSSMPPCESIDRADVTVEITPVPFSGNFPLDICVTEARDLINSPEEAFAYFSSLLQGEEIAVDLANFGPGTQEELEDLLEFIETPLTDSETFNFVYNNPSTNPDCEDGEITIDITINNVEEADAGNFDNQVVCSNDGMIDLTTYIADSGATPGGTFSGVGVENNMFDASIGTNDGGYSITYTVTDSEDDCITGEPSSQFTITVQNAPFSGNIPLNFCIAEAQEIVQEEPDAEEYITTILEDMGINVNPLNFAEGDADELGRLFNYIQNPDSDSETFNFTYTTPANSVCEEGVITIEVTINDGEEANAGEFANQLVCSADGMIDLNDYVAASGATPGGTFSGVGVENNMFDASIGANDSGYIITYTVPDSEDECLTGEPSSQFTITVQNAPFSGNIPLNFCIVEAQEIVQEEPDAEEYITTILEDMGVNVNPLNFAEGDADELGRLFNYIQNPDSDSETFNFTYTTPATNVCEEGVITIAVTIDEEVEADAGNFESQMVCSTEGMIDLTAYIAGSGATPGGTFSGEGVENNMFDASLGANEGGYNITYTVNEIEGDCITGVPSTQFIITVVNGPLSTDLSFNFCITEAQEIVEEPADAEAYISGILEDLGVDVDLNNFAEGDADELGRFYDFIQTPNSDTETFDFTYTNPSQNEDCEDGVITINVVIDNLEEANAGPDTPLTFCSTQGEIDLTNFLNEDANQRGYFEGLEDNLFNPSEAGVGTYTFIYTVDDSVDCIVEEDSATYTVEVIESDVNAGDDIALEYCITEIEEMTEAEALAIFNSLLGEDVDEGGEFSPALETLIAQFIQNPIGIFETTYTVSEGECSDSADLSITINDIENANAGPDTTLTFCSSEGPVDLTNFLNEDANQLGYFEELEDNMFNPSESGIGTYTFTYTVDDSVDCVAGENSATYIVEIIAGPDAGAENSTEICQSDIDEMLPSVTAVRNLYLSLLDEDVSRDGVFSPSIQSIADRYIAGESTGDFTTIYTIGEGNCTDTVELTVTVLENPEAGENATVNLDEEDLEIVDLFEALGGTPDEGGTWTDEDGNTIDGTFDPTTDEEGVFTYTIESDNGCEDSATVTITIGEDPTECTEFPATPTVTNFTGCVVDGATVADLDVTVDEGNTFIVYSDEAMESPVADTEVLTEGIYYVSQMNAEGCESEEAAELTVTLGDSDTPTISQGGNVFCEFDGATIADLEENVSANGDVMWYASATGTDPIATSTTLQNGTTYYAASTDVDSECESSERLAVTVTFEVCEIIIPDAFSPNGDGMNERFEIENLASEYPNFTMEIYNRWGDKVYNGNASTPAWDGVSTESSFGSGVLPAGVYFYILYFNDGQTEPTQGRLYLSR